MTVKATANKIPLNTHEREIGRHRDPAARSHWMALSPLSVPIQPLGGQTQPHAHWAARVHKAGKQCIGQEANL